MFPFFDNVTRKKRIVITFFDIKMKFYIKFGCFFMFSSRRMLKKDQLANHKNIGTIALLVNEKIKKKYSKNNCFVVELPKLEKLLTHISFKEKNSEAFILCKSCRHWISIYIRNDNHQLNAFIFESTGKLQEWALPIIRILNNTLPNIKIYGSTTPLQKDKVTCSVFAISSLQYFAKSGNELFAYLEKHSIKRWYHSCFHLDPNQLPVKLIKLTQYLKENECFQQTSPLTKNTFVSIKKQLTLSQYIEKNTIDKKNVAALNKYKKNETLLKNITDNLDSKQCTNIIQHMSGSFLKALDKTSRLPETIFSDETIQKEKKCRTSI